MDRAGWGDPHPGRGRPRPVFSVPVRPLALPRLSPMSSPARALCGVSVSQLSGASYRLDEDLLHICL